MNIKVLEGNQKVMLALVLQFWFRSNWFLNSFSERYSNLCNKCKMEYFVKLTAKSCQRVSQNALS